MSHTIKVTMTADQVIEVQGKEVNIHDIKTIYVDSQGVITEVATTPIRRMMNTEKKTSEQLAGEHWEWFQNVVGHIAKDFFTHGYKHGKQDMEKQYGQENDGHQ